MDIVERANAVKTKADLEEFLWALIRDLESRPSEWENRTLPEFLEAMTGFVGDLDGYCKNRGELGAPEPTWKLFAEILLASSMYE